MNNYFSNESKNNSKKIAKHLNESNTINLFLKENIEKKIGNNITIESMIIAFNSWCSLTNNSKISKKILISNINKKLIHLLDENNKHIGWKDVNINFCNNN